MPSASAPDRVALAFQFTNELVQMTCLWHNFYYYTCSRGCYRSTEEAAPAGRWNCGRHRRSSPPVAFVLVKSAMSPITAGCSAHRVPFGEDDWPQVGMIPGPPPPYGIVEMVRRGECSWLEPSQYAFEHLRFGCRSSRTSIWNAVNRACGTAGPSQTSPGRLRPGQISMKAPVRTRLLRARGP